MVVIPIKDLEAWDAYCTNYPHAFAYKNKCINNWDNICALVGSDGVTGDEVEQHEESANALDMEIEGLSTSETSLESSSGGLNKKIKRDRLANVISSFVESFKEYVSRAQGSLKPSSMEIYDVISSILGLSHQQVLKAVKRFMSVYLSAYWGLLGYALNSGPLE
ncbi:Uncharacterized protein RDABS01_002737 [Bienertia sinuspersici]